MIASENKKLRSLGTTLSCLGGLLVTFNFMIWQDSKYELAIALVAFALALAGVMMIAKANKKQKAKK